jgi:hypothetical protein
MGSYHRGGTFKLLARLCPKEDDLRRHEAVVQTQENLIYKCLQNHRKQSEISPLIVPADFQVAMTSTPLHLYSNHLQKVRPDRQHARAVEGATLGSTHAMNKAPHLRNSSLPACSNLAPFFQQHLSRLSTMRTKRGLFFSAGIPLRTIPNP